MKTRFLFLIPVLLFLVSCSDEGGAFNFFSVEDDRNMGLQVKNHIESPASGMKILDSTQYPLAYKHLYRIRDYILNSRKLKHKDDFEWRVRIIQDDSVLNAFATPGGYIYVYTGLIKYLDSEDHLAGVLGHEIAHADERHSTANLTKIYGVQLLVSLILGDNYSMLQKVSENLLSLSFSRGAEEDADRLSVEYLCQSPTHYDADGAAGFFKKLMKEEKNGGTIQFLSTHPNPPNRVENIESMAQQLRCKAEAHANADYEKMKKSLP